MLQEYEIDIRELLAVGFAHDKASGLFFNCPGWWEATPSSAVWQYYVLSKLFHPQVWLLSLI